MLSAAMSFVTFNEMGYILQYTCDEYVVSSVRKWAFNGSNYIKYGMQQVLIISGNYSLAETNKHEIISAALFSTCSTSGKKFLNSLWMILIRWLEQQLKQ